MRGRIAPLLALGAGFHPDMTGRECVEVNGTALGLTRAEIRARMDNIPALCRADRFLDTPVRYYCRGCWRGWVFGRCAYRSDLLLVDEVLSVGDHAFQHKLSAADSRHPRVGHNDPVCFTRCRYRRKTVRSRAVAAQRPAFARRRSQDRARRIPGHRRLTPTSPKTPRPLVTPS